MVIKIDSNECEGKRPPRYYLPAYREFETNRKVFCFIPFLPFYWGWKLSIDIGWTIFKDTKELVYGVSWFNYYRKGDGNDKGE